MQVPASSIVCMVISCAVSFALPIGLLLYFRIRKGADILPFFIGCAVFLIFALVLEQLVHTAVRCSAMGSRMEESVLLYALYGGAMAGLFEETGRFLAFKTVLRKSRDKDVNALMYGAGHGGMEAVAILGVSMINNLIYSMLLNSGSASLLTNGLPEEVKVQMDSVFDALVTTPSYQFLLGGVERIFAVALHISFSVLVWFAVKKKGCGWLFPLAIFLHFFVDMVTVLLSGFEVPAIAIEGVILVLAALVSFLAYRIWKQEAEV